MSEKYSLPPNHTLPTKPKCVINISKPFTLLGSIRNLIPGYLEFLFFKLGCAIASRPFVFITGSLLFCLISSFGLLRFREETDSNYLWIPRDAQSLKDARKIQTYFPAEIRLTQIILIDGSNVLTPSVIKKLFQFHELVSAQPQYKSICLKNFGEQCLSSSILQLWNFNKAAIANLTEHDLFKVINFINANPSNYPHLNLQQLFGGIVYNSTEIIRIQSMTMKYFLLESKQNLTEVLEWEDVFVDACLHSKYLEGIQTSCFSHKSFEDEFTASMDSDLLTLSCGYVLVTVFIFIVLSRFNLVEHRFYMLLIELISIGLSILLSYSWASLMGLSYNVMHSVLPFLLLGVGVDYSFIITFEFDRLQQTELSLSNHCGFMLKHSGVSLFVTTASDMAVFAIGYLSSMNGLRSFCVSCAVGIFAIFMLSLAFYLPFLVLDYKRRKSSRDACFFIPLKNHSLNKFSQFSLLKYFFKRVYTPCLVSIPGKVFVFCFSLIFSTISIYGICNLKQEFDMMWFVNEDSFIRNFLQISNNFFPTSGSICAIYFFNVDYLSKRNTLNSLVDSLSEQNFVQNNSVQFWYINFQMWAPNSIKLQMNTTSDFKANLANFLQTPFGSMYISDIKFSGDSIEVSKLSFTYKNLPSVTSEIEAMDATRILVDSYQKVGIDAIAFGHEYYQWEIDKAIQSELIHNMVLACSAIFLITFLFLVNILASLCVVTCVGLALVNTIGMFYFCGLTIDIISTINLVIAVGLLVDYSAHIAARFLGEKGTSRDRIIATLNNIAPVVFCSGFSTFLAFAMLAFSNSYVFEVFFKVFFLVVVFGMFYGLAVLPVLLNVTHSFTHCNGPNETFQESEKIHSIDQANCSTAQS